MEVVVAKIITQEVIVKCISSLSTSILSTYNIYNFIVNHSHSDYALYSEQIVRTDLANKLLLASSLVKHIVKKSHFDEHDVSMDEIVSMYKSDIHRNISTDTDLTCAEVGDGDGDGEEYNIISLIKSNTMVSGVPEPVKVVLYSTLEIIDKINNVLNYIQKRIKAHSGSYMKYFAKLNINHHVDTLVIYNGIFDQRLRYMIDIVSIFYKDILS